MRNIFIIGLGRFGLHCALTLADRAQVTAIDVDEEKIQEVGDRVTRAVVADATKLEVLQELNVGQADAAVVSVGTSLEDSILTTLHLSSLGVGLIYAKAMSDDHAHILRKLGATRVLRPEKEIAENLAMSLSDATIVDYLQLHRDFAIIRIDAPESLQEKSLRELSFRAEFGLTVIGIFRQDDRLINPGPNTKIFEGDELILLGSEEHIRDFEDQLN